MQQKITLQRSLVVILAILALSSATIFFLVADLPGRDVPAKIASAELARNTTGEAGYVETSLASQASSSLPVHLNIPIIGVDATIEYVGLSPDGSVGVPKGPENAAWFNQGPLPGGIGSAVIVGHFGWKNDIPAVFDNLNKLRPGDKFQVQDEKGATTTFIVRKLQTYGEHADAASVFSSDDGKAHLNLITCEGAWNEHNKSYANRLVVFTDKIAE